MAPRASAPCAGACLLFQAGAMFPLHAAKALSATRSTSSKQKCVPCARGNLKLTVRRLGRFQLDQVLQRDPHGFTDQVHALPGAEHLEQLGQGRLGQGHR